MNKNKKYIFYNKTRQNKMKITNFDLQTQQFNFTILEDNIKELDCKIVLRTQKLTADFCVRYILNIDLESGDEDSYLLDGDYILKYQKHLTMKELEDAYYKLNNK